MVFPFSTNLPRGGRVVFCATTGSRRADRVKTLLLFGGASSSVHIPFRGGRLAQCGSIPVSFPFFSNHGILVLVSFYEYWHWIVAGFLSPTQWMILDCYMMSHPMIPYGVVLCPSVMLTSHLTLVRELGRA